ncbi:U-box domain-containing protein 5 isoform X2 [Diospyros lotus]|uniref:U-box domain-containing protein 5 isoform X2 n=1 Tax=Diospyros lotus TaxID=55363 RepID=UPI00225A3ED9|nr:U-box domain-containing protein 5 isoform X2 [Diospyros lotus]
MGTDVTGVIETVPSPRDIKVHRLMCTRLMILVDRILKIFPDIEVCRPRCSSGIQPLCLLNKGIEKAHLLFQHCSESSKLYLAITGDAILSRCLKSRNLLGQSLSQIESNVPVMLAAEISRIISDIRGAIFSLDSSEEAAGKALRELLQQYASSRPADATEESAIEAIRFAALRLQITTQKDLLIEKRAIKKLLVKIGGGDLPKRQILLFLVSLLERHGSLIVREQAENSYVQHEESFSVSSSYNASSVESCAEHGPDEVKMDMLSRCVPPEEFKCPISSGLMYDPVVIDSGQTFERMWIQKWFDEGHDTCPKTKQKLLHLSLTPNVGMKDLISKWCRDNGVTIPDPCIRSTAVHSLETSFTSIASLSNSMNNLRLPIDLSNISLGSLDSTNSDSSHVKITDSSDLVSVQTKDRYRRIQSCPKTHERSKCSLNNLDELPWESQCEAVDDAKWYLEHCDHASNAKSLENFVEPLIQFLKHAHDLHDVKAQRSGIWLLLELVSMYRSSEPPLHEESYSLLALLLNSEVAEEALAIMEVLSCQGRCIPKITASGAPYSVLNMLETEIREFHGPAIRILCNLSSSREIRSLFVPSEFIPRCLKPAALKPKSMQ